MDDQFDEPLVYSSESDEDNQLDTATPSVDKLIDEVPTEVEQQTETFADDEEPIISNRVKKSKKILSSDDDSDAPPAEHPDSDMETDQRANDDDIEKEDVISEEPTQSFSRIRSTLWDSDSSDGDAQVQEQPVKVAKKKVLKKKKDKKKRIVESKGSDDDDSSSSSDDENKEKNAESGNSSSQSSNDTDEETPNADGGPQAPREKPQQRMSAKAAVEQMKEIHSESQRLARQIYINVPYHKPKQHSLKEFLSRRSLAKQQENANRIPGQKTAAAIKMSAEELELYAESLEQRAQEAIEFFRNEDDDMEQQKDGNESENGEAIGEEKSPEETNDIVPENTDVESTAQTEECKLDSVEDPVSVAVNPDTSEDMIIDAEPVTQTTDASKEVQTMDTEPIVETNTDAAMDMDVVMGPIELPAEGTNAVRSPDELILHTEKSDLDVELDKMISDDNRRKRLQALSLSLDVDAMPRLSGNKNMMIDLESNEVKPIEKTGVEELQDRFLRSAIPKSKTSSTNVSVFNTEIGRLETVSHTAEPVLRVDPKPGEAYYRLKRELAKQLNEKRRETLMKRVEEENQKRLEMESEDEEEMLEEYSDCGAEESDNEEAEGDIEDSKTNADDNLNENEFLDHEAVDDEDEEESNDDSHASNDENDVEEVNDENRTRKRIIAPFEDDSEDETPQPVSATNTSARSLNDSAPADLSFGEIPATTNTQMDEAKRQEIIDDMNEFESELLDTKTQVEAPRMETSTLAIFAAADDNEEIGESQLMALCSGAFVTQKPDGNVVVDAQDTPAVPVTETQTAEADVPAVVDLKETLMSSDDENKDEGSVPGKKKKKKLKKRKIAVLDYSDDEEENGKNRGEPGDGNDDEADGEEEEEAEEAEDDQEMEDEEEDLGEKYVEYDSDENEIEVRLDKKALRRKASDFVEREAELSGSEWGSGDEDERELDQYDTELLNDEEFDQSKLHSELERIRLRQQIDQDAREVRILKEMFIEDEEDIGQRERKFRWKNINDIDATTMQATEDNDLLADQDDDENEEEWRRLRYEREQLLQKQMAENDTAEASTTTPNLESNQNGENVTSVVSSIFRRTSLLKTANTSSSPFLINQSALMSTHVGRKSFLNRDDKTMEKLVSLTKAAGDGETVKSTATGKGNYIFLVTEKKVAEKRKSDVDHTIQVNPSKKVKSATVQKTEQTKKKIRFLDLLSKQSNV